MTNFIEEFYYGNIEPQSCSIKSDGRIQKELELLSKNEELLLEKLTGEEKKLFLDYVNTWAIVSGVFNSESFTSGFRLGARFTYDTFKNDEYDD